LPIYRRRTANQRSGHFIPIRVWKDVSSNSILTRNGNGSYGTEEWQRYNGTSQWHNRMAERNGKTATATEWWKPGNQALHWVIFALDIINYSTLTAIIT